MIDLEKIKPKIRGESDKYSWNLYQYLKKKKHESEVYRSPHHSGSLMIGLLDEEGWFFGTPLPRVMGHNKTQTYAYPPNMTKDFIPVPDFWETYEKIGRCAMDPGHEVWFRGGESRFVEEDGERTRRCLWCGKIQKKYVTKKVVEEIHWRDVE